MVRNLYGKGNFHIHGTILSDVEVTFAGMGQAKVTAIRFSQASLPNPQ
jgi:hypothetical protein